MDISPRHYQEEVFELAQKSNTIAALDTGAGKTFIGLLLLKWVSAVKQGAKSIFFVPKVALVEQQGQFIASNSLLRVLRLHGALEIDLADRKGWIKKFENHDVFVLLCLANRVALMIFDECHHARKNHPYNGIMREYFEIASPQLRPKIFGMTASPDLSPPLSSTITTEELAIHAPKVSEGYDLPSPTLWMCLSVFKTTFSNLNMGWDDIERRYATTLLNLGPYGSSLYLWLEINHRISQFREIGGLSDDSYPPEASSSQSLLAELVHIQDILAAFDHLSGSLPVCLEWCSPKIRTLVDILLSRASQTSHVKSPFCLARMLPCIPVLRDVVRCAELVGQGDGTDGNTLQLFREGRINLTEEGLDLPVCSAILVIRFDALQHMIGYVQSRGRARSKASTFVVMVEENDSVQLARYKAPDRRILWIQRMYMDEDEVHPTDLANRERYVVPSTNAVLSYDNAVNLLNRLCALVTHDAFTSSHCPKYSGDFQAVVQLPSNLGLPPQDLRYQGPEKLSKKEAQRAVAFKAVKRLHELDVFDQYLLPVPSARKGREENDGTPLLDVDQIPITMCVSVKDPWTTDYSQRLWIHPIFIENRRVAGLVTGTELYPVELNCGQSRVRTAAAELVSLDERHQREMMYLFTKECIWYRITRTPLEHPSRLYLVPIADTGQPDFPAMQRFLASSRGNANWEGIDETDYGRLMVVNVNLTGHTYLLRQVRSDLSPSSVPPDGSPEAGFPNYHDYWVHKWTGKPGSRKRPPYIPDSGPLLELSLYPRSTAACAYPLDSKPFTATGPPAPTTTPCNVLFPRDCCRWVDISEDVREALGILPALYHRMTDIYRVRRARAFTLPSANAGYSNQRLETLGDAVLQLCTTVHLFNRYPNRHEGQLSLLRQNSVCNRFLLSRAKEIGLETFLTCETQGARPCPVLDDFLRTSRCISREFPKRSLQDCMEATLGASFVTGGIDMSLHTGRALGLDFGGPMPWNIRYRIPEASPVPSMFLELEETLGDAILDLAVIDYMYRKFPDADSDQLAWPRTKAICASALAFVAVRCLKLHHLMLVNNACSGEEIVQRGWRYDPPKALSDVFESVVGAILVDSNYNYERTVSMVEFVMQDVLDALTPSLRRDPISELMEWAGISGCISSKHIVFKFVRDCRKVAPLLKGGQYSVTTTVHGVAVAGPIFSASAFVAKQLAAEQALPVLADSANAKSLARLCDCPHGRDSKSV
ncbi:hypothetical protein B0H14DRAFT_3612709 [Mycena olivaceomarginata]|nr:hypothetical protein B0H14DRAFT_3612709 [Mycena olivaceomarginata]